MCQTARVAGIPSPGECAHEQIAVGHLQHRNKSDITVLLGVRL